MIRRGVTNQTTALMKRISIAVHEIVPAARVILYGSRARGDASPDSDWDILVIVDGGVNRTLEDAISHKLYILGLETDGVLSVLVYSRDEWDSALHRAMPFHENVLREGILC